MSMRVVYNSALATDTTQCHGLTARSNRRCRRQVAHYVLTEGPAEAFMAPLKVYCPWHRESG